MRMFVLLTWYCFLVVAVSIQARDVPAQSGTWKPDRPVEFIVGTSPGGSIDRTARAAQRMLNDKGLLASAIVVNKPGGGGAIAYHYLNQHPGGHHVAFASLTLLTTHIAGTNQVRYSDLTPVALLTSEYQTFAVRPESSIRNAQDLLDLLRRDPGSVSIGGASARGSSNHIAAGLVMKVSGLDAGKMKFVVFNSSGESVTAVLGGHVDVLVTSASTAIPHVQAGRLRMIAIAAPKRASGALADVPTWREQGVNAVFSNWFGVFGPRGMSAMQVAYWDDLLGKLVKTPEWQAELDRYSWVNDYLNSKAMGSYLDEQYAELRSVLTHLGVVK